MGRENLALKRAFDFTAALFGMVLLSPVIAIAMAAIRMETPGPALFAQTRVGRGGLVFTCYKLRTMRTGIGDKPSHEVGASAITPLGAKLRRWKLDELPQLWNVFRGEMSLVGPRPCLPSQTELIEARRARGVLNVRPGVTGVAQIRGVDMSNPVLLATTDAEYLLDRSFFNDIKLIFMTVLGAGRGDAVR